MERAKLAVWSVIAVCLCKLAFGGGIDEAKAASGAVSCEAFLQDPGGALTKDKAVKSSREWVTPVQAWLEQHPGSTAFATELYANLVYVICVRGD